MKKTSLQIVAQLMGEQVKATSPQAREIKLPLAELINIDLYYQADDGTNGDIADGEAAIATEEDF